MRVHLPAPAPASTPAPQPPRTRSGTGAPTPASALVTLSWVPATPPAAAPASARPRHSHPAPPYAHALAPGPAPLTPPRRAPHAALPSRPVPNAPTPCAPTPAPALPTGPALPRAPSPSPPPHPARSCPARPAAPLSHAQGSRREGTELAGTQAGSPELATGRGWFWGRTYLRCWQRVGRSPLPLHAGGRPGVPSDGSFCPLRPGTPRPAAPARPGALSPAPAPAVLPDRRRQARRLPGSAAVARGTADLLGAARVGWHGQWLLKLGSPATPPGTSRGKKRARGSGRRPLCPVHFRATAPTPPVPPSGTTGKAALGLSQTSADTAQLCHLLDLRAGAREEGAAIRRFPAVFALVTGGLGARHGSYRRPHI